ncbi:MAG: polysaccharide biosynthesis tyrosine autokinase [Bacteroidota bacterium]
MDQLSNTLSSQQDNFQLKRFLNLIIGKWYFVVGCLSIALGIAYGILRYQSPVFLVNTTFVTKKFTEDVGVASSLLRLAESGASLTNGNQVYQEIPLLKSQGRIMATLEKLDFDVSYFIQGKFKTSEVYPSDYYKIIQSPASKNYPYNLPIYIIPDDDGHFTLQTEDETWNNAFSGQSFISGKTNNINGWQFVIEVKPGNQNGSNDHFFMIRQPYQLMNEYRNRLILNWDPQGRSILIASIMSELPEKDLDFLNTYFEVVVEKGLEEKSQEINSLVDFINEYIPQISDTLYMYQKKLDQFRLENRELINGSGFIMERLNALETQKAAFLISDYYYDHIVDYLKSPREEAVFAPAMFGLESNPLATLLEDYSEIIWEDKVDKNSFNDRNPLINKYNEDLEVLEKNILENVKNLKVENSRKMTELDARIDFYYNTMEDLQVESREYAELSRMIALYEGVFDNLITKRTEAFLSQAAIVSDYEMVTNPYFNSRDPVSPDFSKVVIIAILSGLGLPLSILYLLSVSSAKIVSKFDLLDNTTIPLLGYVGHSLDKDDLVVYHKPKSLVAESFRRVRANLQYFRQSDKKNVLLITSSISAEGKTFCSTNLAFTYAMAGKKTVIVGADMRKPTLSHVFDLNGSRGLSNFLAGQVEIKDIIHKSNNQDLYLIPGGSIPPNPAELILTPRMKDLMDYLKKEFEVVIVDTPPVGLVADAIELMEFSDLNILVVRQNKTFKKSLHETSENYEKGQLKNMTILFNDVNFEKLEYGYKAYVESYQTYGYGYDSGYLEDEKNG